MDFENGKNNPYEVLGVPFGASIEVCKATYKSLTKIYHPDVFVGEKKYAQKRMAELNAAFEFLNNPKNKKNFDEAGEQANHNQYGQDFETENESDEFTQASKILKENWEFACEYHPEIKKFYDDLNELSPKTSFLFMAVIVEEKLYDSASELAEYLEDKFLTSKFGDDVELKKIAKYAILKKEKEFAKDLNRALKILGEGSKEQILTKLVSDYPDIGYHALHNAFLDYLIPDDNPHKKENSKQKTALKQAKARHKRTGSFHAVERWNSFGWWLFKGLVLFLLGILIFITVITMFMSYFF